ncbi:MAG: cell division protein FtsZ [Methylacidiphilales bacterium]|nr:cell division protein FtsZ [Candidatus Methylacidiphilales bacterium]
MFEYVQDEKIVARIKIAGIGGAGGNAILHMIKRKLQGVRFLSINTDKQVLMNCSHPTLQIGAKLTKGFGAGANPEVGKNAAEEDVEAIRKELADVDMLFISAGMGGGTGTGASPIVASVAREIGILTVAVVTTPFSYEGAKRSAIAEQGIHELEKVVDSIIIIPNDKLLLVFGGNHTWKEARESSNEVLYGAVRGIADLVTCVGMINIDFADLRSVMSAKGRAIMGTGSASGQGRARKATEQAITCPLLDHSSLQEAKGLLVNITSDDSITMDEMTEIGTMTKSIAQEDDQTVIVIGHVEDQSLQGEIRVSVVATGLKYYKSSIKQQPEAIPVQKTVVEVVQNQQPPEEDLMDDSKTQDAIPVLNNPVETFNLKSPDPISKPQNKKPTSRLLGVSTDSETKERSVTSKHDKVDLNMPTFLRNQAN